jgi:hypothetical protein
MGLAGLNEPQALAGVQLQFTPPLDESFVTVAVIAACPPVGSVAGAVVPNDTLMVVVLIVIAAVVALLVLSATEVAVMVTVPEGAVDGAV